MSNDYIEVIRRVLGPLHVPYTIKHRSKHPVVTGTHNGKEFLVPFPSSPSDVRGVRNFETQLRHALGLVRHEKTISQRRRSRHRSRDARRRIRTVAVTERAPLRPDRFFAPLREIQQRMEALPGQVEPPVSEVANGAALSRTRCVFLVRLPRGWLVCVKDGSISLGERDEAIEFATKQEAVVYLATENVPQDFFQAVEIVPANDNHPSRGKSSGS